MFKRYSNKVETTAFKPFKPAYVIEFTPNEQDEQVKNTFKEITNKCLKQYETSKSRKL